MKRSSKNEVKNYDKKQHCRGGNWRWMNGLEMVWLMKSKLGSKKEKNGYVVETKERI